jgi:hypothetical protein
MLLKYANRLTDKASDYAYWRKQKPILAATAVVTFVLSAVRGDVQEAGGWGAVRCWCVRGLQ